VPGKGGGVGASPPSPALRDIGHIADFVPAERFVAITWWELSSEKGPHVDGKQLPDRFNH